MTSEAKKKVEAKVPEQPKKEVEKDYMTLRNEKRAKRLAAQEKRAKKGL